MNITVARSNVKALRPGDPHFTISNGLVITSRASFEISNRCPENYRSLIQECIQHGWLKSVAHVTEEEYMVMQLSN
jgi:hypothetical protein